MNIEIADRLQKLRKEKGYSQETLADALGISRQAVSKWERAEASPDTDNLILLARLYDMSLDDLLSTDESTEDIVEVNKDRNSESISLTDDEGQTVKLEGDSIKFINPDGTEEKLNKKALAIKSAIGGSIVLATIIGFLVWGLVFDGFYVSWVLFVLMPAVMSIIECISKKQISEFAYPLLITAIYLFLGMEFGLWHPYWFLFITIPAFYMITGPIDKYVFKTKKDEEEAKK